MGANTSYYVRVLKTHEEWIEVSALTDHDALLEAVALPGVIDAKEAVHWSIYESDRDGNRQEP